MHEGEVVLVRSSSRFAYGIIGDAERGILPNQDMEYEIGLLKVNKGVTYTDMPRDELVRSVFRLKERGNYYYSRKEFEKAVFVYKRLLKFTFLSLIKVRFFLLRCPCRHSDSFFKVYGSCGCTFSQFIKTNLDAFQILFIKLR